MDSRIREIEQWITEAKTDLDERGREAYVNKLYLLDAEIRSVIRENGMQPGAASPQPAGQRVRRAHAFPAFASGIALGALLLAASTVYFASPGITLPWSGAKTQTRLLANATPSLGTALPAGEELVTLQGGGASHPLTQYSSSPSEEKAGDHNPAVMQASGTEAPLIGNSKPSALAHPSAPAPASTSAGKIQIKIKAPAAGPVPAPAARPAPSRPTFPPMLIPADFRSSSRAVTVPALKHSTGKDESTPVSVDKPSAQPVDKPAVDNGDKTKKLDPKALAKIAEATFAH